jgi:RNA polymerase sigma-70 factor (ECF subfamily)
MHRTDVSIAVLEAPRPLTPSVALPSRGDRRYGCTTDRSALAEVRVPDAGVREAAPQDAALADRLRNGDADAFAHVVASYSPAMLHVARGFVSTSASAEEVVQEAWLAVIKGLDAFEGRASLRTWACRITANIARRRGVLDARTVPWTDAFADGDAGGGPTVDASRFRGADGRWPGGWTEVGAPATWGPERAALDAEARAVVAEALSRLPDRHRTVVALRDLHGLSAEEVCDALGLTMGNQRVLLHRGRAQLRQLLEDYHVSKEGPR